MSAIGMYGMYLSIAYMKWASSDTHKNLHMWLCLKMMGPPNLMEMVDVDRS